jgi:hypothetical protein
MKMLLSFCCHTVRTSRTTRAATNPAAHGGSRCEPLDHQAADRPRRATEQLNGYGGTPLGQAGWSFVNGDPDDDYVPIFDALLAAGAHIEDGLAGLARQAERAYAGTEGPNRRVAAQVWGEELKLQ